MSERAMIKVGTITLVLVLLSLLKSCNEIVYMMHGKETQARLLSVKEVKETRGARQAGGATRTRLEVKYSFDDEHVDRPRVEADRVSLRFVIPESTDEQGRPAVDIEYVPGQKLISRVAGHDDKMWVYVFFGSLAVGGVIAGAACYRFYKS